MMCLRESPKGSCKELLNSVSYLMEHPDSGVTGLGMKRTKCCIS